MDLFLVSGSGGSQPQGVSRVLAQSNSSNGNSSSSGTGGQTAGKGQTEQGISSSNKSKATYSRQSKQKSRAQRREGALAATAVVANLQSTADLTDCALFTSCTG